MCVCVCIIEIKIAGVLWLPIFLNRSKFLFFELYDAVFYLKGNNY